MSRHTDICNCPTCCEKRGYHLDTYEDVTREQQKANERRIKIYKIMTEVLGIPMDTQFSLLSADLYDIFMDDEKFEELVSKVKNKAFW